MTMPKSAKPKRAYKPRDILKPLKARNNWALEGDVHIALVAIKADIVQEEHLAMLASHADLVRRLETAPFHALRHSCASILIASGADLYTVAKILGHASTRTTERYAHLEVKQQRAAMRKAFG